MAQTRTSSHSPQRQTGRIKPRKRAAHLGPERRRPEVLDAALDLFLEHGYQGASMQAVADQAGVTKPVVYACFPSKDELFRALLRREEDRINGEIQGAFADADLDPKRTLTEGFTAFLRAVATSPDVYRLIFLQEGGGNMAVARRIQRGREAQVDALSLLARGWLTRRSGKKRSEKDLDTTARVLGNAIAGLAEAGARLLLSGVDGWTPETLGPELGKLGDGAQAAL